MRRDKEEIKSEILRRRDEYKAGRIRFRRTVGISAVSGLATLAIVFMLVTSPTVQKMMGKKPAAQDAIQDGSSGQMIFTPESVQARRRVSTTSPAIWDSGKARSPRSTTLLRPLRFRRSITP